MSTSISMSILYLYMPRLRTHAHARTQIHLSIHISSFTVYPSIYLTNTHTMRILSINRSIHPSIRVAGILDVFTDELMLRLLACQEDCGSVQQAGAADTLLISQLVSCVDDLLIPCIDVIDLVRNMCHIHTGGPTSHTYTYIDTQILEHKC